MPRSTTERLPFVGAVQNIAAFPKASWFGVIGLPIINGTNRLPEKYQNVTLLNVKVTAESWGTKTNDMNYYVRRSHEEMDTPELIMDLMEEKLRDAYPFTPEPFVGDTPFLKHIEL